MDCQTFRAKLPNWLPDLILDPDQAPLAAKAHLKECPPCATFVEQEREAIEQTMLALNHWEAPEVSPYFNSRMGALLREEQARPRTGFSGWWQRIRTSMLVTNVQLKPILGGGALALVLVAAGGGAWFNLSQPGTPVPTPAAQSSPIVRDLQSLDENAPVFQQLSSIDTSDDGGTAPQNTL